MSTELSQFEDLRMALVGAASMLGKEVKDQLAASGVPHDAVSLFDFEEVVGVLTKYGEEARVFAETVSESLLEHELSCFCSDPTTARECLDKILDSGKIGIDCTDAWLNAPAAFTWIPGVSACSVRGCAMRMGWTSAHGPVNSGPR